MLVTIFASFVNIKSSTFGVSVPLTLVGFYDMLIQEAISYTFNKFEFLTLRIF